MLPVGNCHEVALREQLPVVAARTAVLAQYHFRALATLQAEITTQLVTRDALVGAFVLLQRKGTRERAVRAVPLPSLT